MKMQTITYMTGLLTFYLKGQITTDQNFVKIKIPNTILSLIPLGSQKHNIPVNQISNVASSFHLNFKDFIVGIIEVFIAFALFGNSVVAGIILLFIGVSTIITSFVTLINVSSTDGSDYTIPFLIFEKAKAGQVEDLINNMVAGRLNDTNNRQVTETQTNVLVDAITNNKQ